MSLDQGLTEKAPLEVDTSVNNSSSDVTRRPSDGADTRVTALDSSTKDGRDRVESTSSVKDQISTTNSFDDYQNTPRSNNVKNKRMSTRMYLDPALTAPNEETETLRTQDIQHADDSAAARALANAANKLKGDLDEGVGRESFSGEEGRRSTLGRSVQQVRIHSHSHIYAHSVHFYCPSCPRIEHAIANISCK